MPKKKNFSVQDFESINEQDYLRGKNVPHIFHSLKWMKIVKETLGVKCKIALLEENKVSVASIPFVSYRNLIKGQCALPLQFSGYYDSVFADNINLKKKILSQFFKYCKEFNYFTQISEINSINGYQCFSGYSVYKIKLKTGVSVEEQILAGANKRMRDYTKKAIKSSLSSFTGGIELLDKFYTLYLQNMKELGTPPLPKNFFKKIIKSFPELTRIILVKDHKKLCSSIFLLKVTKSELFAPVICTPRFYQTDQSSHLVYLQAVREAQKMKCLVMNFGRSIDGSGPALFKKRYGLEASPLLIYSPYKNWTVTDPKNSILRHAVTIWKRLPILLTKLGGIILAKHVI
ncbi:hypothetical protein OAR76_02615 [Candidatus Pelagibacter sp.]|nr:hypothetical protein [Candidatus Pelagibacter sp.]